MNKKKVLITGGMGFIGRNMVNRFAARDDVSVRAVYFKSIPADELKNNPNIELVQADLTKRDDVKKVLEGVDVIIQAADVTAGAQVALSNPLSLITDKVIMNSLIMEQAIEAGVKHLIFLSCTNMYPNQINAVKESDFEREKIHPKYFAIGTTKVYLEDMCKYLSQKGVKTTAIRHSNIYGPNDKYDLERSHVFGATVTKVLTNTDGKMVVWGDGSEIRDLVYVSDLVDFVEMMIQKQQDPYELINVGASRGFSIKELAEKIITASGKQISIEFDTSKPMTNFSLVLDCSYAKEKYGWVPKISLDEGIKKTIEWYNKEKLKVKS